MTEQKRKMGRPRKYDPSMTDAEKMRALRQQRLKEQQKPIQIHFWLTSDQYEAIGDEGISEIRAIFKSTVDEYINEKKAVNSFTKSLELADQMQIPGNGALSGKYINK